MLCYKLMFDRLDRHSRELLVQDNRLLPRTLVLLNRSQAVKPL